MHANNNALNVDASLIYAVGAASAANVMYDSMPIQGSKNNSPQINTDFYGPQKTQTTRIKTKKLT